MRLLLLNLEFSLLFIAVPLLIHYRILPNLPIPYSETGFETSQLISINVPTDRLPGMFLRDIICLTLLSLAVRLYAPELLFSFVRRAPVFWVVVMVLYPLASVFPQELLYRAYLFHRFQPLFGYGWTMIVASGLAFGFVHVTFGNWLAVVLCVFGGLMFVVTYDSSRSLLLACLEHAVFGNFLSTIGLGRFFYHGSGL